MTAGRGNVARLCFDDRQCRHAAAAECIGKMRGALQQTGVQVENVARIGFTARGTLEQKAQCTVRDSVLREVIVHDEDVSALIHEVLAECAAGIRCDVLQGSRVTGGGVDDDGVIHGAAAL